MFELRVIAEFSAGHRLLESGTKCDAPHGHNYRAEVFLKGETLDRRGMVRELTEVKNVVRGVVDSWWDHKFLLNSRDEQLQESLRAVDPLCVYIFDNENPTAEAMARRLWRELRANWQLPVSRVRIWETERQYAEYSPHRHDGSAIASRDDISEEALQR